MDKGIFTLRNDYGQPVVSWLRNEGHYRVTGKETKDQKTVRWSIKWKLMGIITLLVLVLVAVLSYTQISSQRKILEMELNERNLLSS